MNSQERYVRALTFQCPDRVPIFHNSHPGAFRVHGSALHELYAKYPSDILQSNVAKGSASRAGGAFTFHDHSRGEWGAKDITHDDWGCGWRFSTADYLGQVVEHPLADWSALDSFRPPDPMVGEEGIEFMEEAVRLDDHQHFVLVDAGELWQRMFFLRGFENTLVDLVEGEPQIYVLRDMVVDWILERIERWLETRMVDGILIRDDWGTQDALMVRPSMWQQMFKPAYRRLVDAIHTGGAYAFFHCDGCVWEIVSDLVELGWDELNLQTHLMDVKEMGHVYGGRVCFRPSLDRQRTLPRGTREEVKAHIIEMFNAFGRFHGGYVGSGIIGPDVPLSNVEAMLDAFAGLRYHCD